MVSKKQQTGPFVTEKKKRYLKMSGASDSNGKLIATAVGAAAAGAVLAVAAMRMMDTGRRNSSATDMISAGRPRKPSYIMNEPDKTLNESFSDGKSGMVQMDSKTLLFPHNHEEKMRRRIATRYTIEEENNMPRESVTVRVPATSANVGPGCTYGWQMIVAGYVSSVG